MAPHCIHAVFKRSRSFTMISIGSQNSQIKKNAHSHTMAPLHTHGAETENNSNCDTTIKKHQFNTAGHETSRLLSIEAFNLCSPEFQQLPLPN